MKKIILLILVTILVSIIVVLKQNTVDAAGTQFSFTVFLHGIGKSGDNVNPNTTGTMTPITTQRPMTTQVYDTNNTLVTTLTSTLQFNPELGNFVGTADYGTLPTGYYLLKVYTEPYLWRQIPQIIQVTAGQTVSIPPFAMVVGDSNNDNRLSILDYNLILDCFSDLTPARNCDATKKKRTDITDDGNVNQFDYNLFLRELSVQHGDTVPLPSFFPTAGASPTIVAPSPFPTGSQTTSGIWISQQEILSRAMSGATWSTMSNIANGNLGSPNISDQDSQHPENTLAAALVAMRIGSAPLKQKTADALISAIGTENNPDPNCASSTLGARSLAVGRNLLAYVIAADVLNFRSGGYDPSGNGTKFQQWVHMIRFKKTCDNNGAAALTKNLSETHDGSTSNGDAMAGASRIAAAAYLNDKTELDKAWLTFRRYAGDGSVGPNFQPNSYSGKWKATNSPSYVGINPKGSHCSGSSSSYPADGVIPNDQGRGGDCPASGAPAYTQYPWEGLQGIYPQALILQRMGYKDPSGKNPWQASDEALKRAVAYQCDLQKNYGGSWYDSGRAAWVKHLAFYVYGYRCYIGSNNTNPVIPAPSGGTRNMDWTQWTHQ